MPEKTIAQEVARVLGEYGDILTDPDQPDAFVQGAGTDEDAPDNELFILFDNDTKRRITIGDIENA